MIETIEIEDLGNLLAGCEFKKIELVGNKLEFTFDKGRLFLYDEKQLCCEDRYMHTDDELSYFISAKFRKVEVRDGPDESVGSGIKESQFLIVFTDRGEFTVVNYNKHNGYYGGFYLTAEFEPWLV